MADDRIKAPAFQFYPKDFLTDVKQMSMSLAETGAYWRLCCHCWLGEDLPADLRVLGRLCGATSRQMHEMWPAIGPCFIEADGRLRHKRLDAERDKQLMYRQEQSVKGKASAAARAHRAATDAQPKSNRGSTEPLTERPPEPKSSSPSSSSSPSPDVCDTRGASVMAGTLPRDFRGIGWISKRGKHVPAFLHAEFRDALSGDEVRLKAFYETTEQGWPEGPIGDQPIPLWRAEFAKAFPSVAPTSAAKPRHGQFLGHNKGAEIADV